MNLLNLLKYQLGSNLTDQLGNFLGESPQKVQSAMDAVLPSVLSVFVKKASESSGANDIMDTIKLGNHDGSMLNYLTGLFSGGSSTNSLLSTGDVLANKFLGNKKSVLGDAITNFSGVRKESSNTLIKMAMPLIMGVIGKQVKNQNLDTSGLMSLLSAQKGHIGAAIPSGFTISNNLHKKQSTETPVTTPKPEVKPTAPTPPKRTINETISKQKVQQSSRTATPVVQKTATSDGPGFLRFLPFIIAGLLGLAILIFALRSCSKKATAEEGKKTTATVAAKDKNQKDAETKDVTAENNSTKDNSASDNSSSSNNSYDDNSSSNSSSDTYYEPSTPRGEFKSKLTSLIGKGDLGSSPIDLDGLRFKGGSPVITKNSRHIISELADVMQSNSNLRIKLESSDVTKAVSVKKGLMDAGINRDRIVTASGGGSGVQMYMY